MHLPDRQGEVSPTQPGCTRNPAKDQNRDSHFVLLGLSWFLPTRILVFGAERNLTPSRHNPPHPDFSTAGTCGSILGGG